LYLAIAKKNDAYLSGEIKDGYGKKIYLDQLQLISQSAVTVDSATIEENDQFAFTHFKPNLNFYRVRMDQQNFAILVLDSTDKVTFVADAKNLADAKITGSKETDAFNEFNAISKKYKNRVDSLQQVFQAELMKDPNDSVKINKLKTNIDAVYQGLISKWADELAAKVKQHPDKFASIVALQMLDPQKYPDVYEQLDKGLGL
jgi:hypothetical protein